MKYMGSKRWMLSNGLGHLLIDEAQSSDRFVDLFSGTAAVSWHVAEHCDVPVLSADLQEYSAVLARSVIGRTRSIDSSRIAKVWLQVADERRKRSTRYRKAQIAIAGEFTASKVLEARKTCRDAHGIIAKAYGGYYLSPAQAMTADILLDELPKAEPSRSVCLSTLIWSLTRCVAAPGHTAQPFQPTGSGLPFIQEAWERDVLDACSEVVPEIARRSAKRVGRAIVGDAIAIAKEHVGPGDMVFVDPPYSAAQYSRFYHVLETVARGQCGPVSGGGRYPPAVERPRSAFSLLSQAEGALKELLSVLGTSGSRVVMTFPQHACSNGVSGEELLRAGREWFEIDVMPVRMRHSTLGGNNEQRSSRRASVELIMAMRPKKRRNGRPSEMAKTAPGAG